MNSAHIVPAGPDADDPVVAKAIEWMVALRSGECDSAMQQAFDHWRGSDARHAAAVTRLEQGLARLRELPRDAHGPARRVLLAAPARRKMLRDTLALAAVGLGGAALMQRYTPLETLSADLRTNTGQRKRVMLADGSELWLNARSAVNVDFNIQQRRLHLLSGEITISVARDAVRPFIVHTEHGSAQALGTRFLVRKEAHDTLLSVLHSAVKVTTASGRDATFSAGQEARFDAQTIVPLAHGSSDAAAWIDGFVEVHDRPLFEVIDALKPYRSGVLRCSEAAGALRVTGAFPLDDSNRTLAALDETLPIAIHRRTDYWVSIDLR